MKASVQPFLAALTYFTRIRSPIAIDAPRAEGSACLAPFIGWIVGGMAAVVFAIGLQLFPLSIAIVISMIASVLLTGGLHEDGWMDFCDGFGAGKGRDETLRIMRDSHVGAFAVLGAILVLLLKFTALVAIATSLAAGGVSMVVVLAAILVAAHGASRFVAVAFMFTREYVTGDTPTRAASMAKPMSAEEFGIAALGGLLPVIVVSALTSWVALFAIVPLLFVYVAMDHLLDRRLGGYTGDCLGAVQQLSELVFYLGVLVLMAG